jgi:hypothetical protein
MYIAAELLDVDIIVRNPDGKFAFGMKAFGDCAGVALDSQGQTYALRVDGEGRVFSPAGQFIKCSYARTCS